MKRITIHNPCNLEGSPVSALFPGDEYKAITEREEVQLVDVNDQDLTYAEVLNVWVGPLAHVPAMLLEMAHDPLQRSFAGAYMHRRGQGPQPGDHRLSAGAPPEGVHPASPHPERHQEGRQVIDFQICEGLGVVIGLDWFTWFFGVSYQTRTPNVRAIVFRFGPIFLHVIAS